VPVSEVVEINPRLPAAQRKSGDQPVSFVSMADVSEGGFVVTYQTRRKSDVVKGYTYFGRGDVLTAKITPCMQNGKAAVLDAMPHEFGFGSTEFHVLRPKQGIDARYIFHMIWSPYFRSAAELSFTGTAGQQRVPTDFFNRFEIPLPALSEQKRIAGILDQADGLRRKRQQALALTDQFLRSTFLDLFGDPVTNPKQWPVVCLNDLFVEMKYGTSTKCTESRDGDALPVLRIPNVVGGQVNRENLRFASLPNNETAKLRLKVGDMLFVRTNGNPDYIGRCAVFDGGDATLFASYLIRARIGKDAKCRAHFLKDLMSFPTYRSVVLRVARTTAGNYNMSTQGLKDLRLPLPPTALQDRYLTIANHMNGLRTKASSDSQHLDALFDSLVQRAFRGEL